MIDEVTLVSMDDETPHGAANKRPIVVKLGGNAVASDTLSAVADDVAWFVNHGQRVVLVHGGGPQVSAVQRRLRQKPRIVSGRRVTNAATLQTLKMVVGGQLNIDVCAGLLAAGVDAVGLTGASALTLQAVRRPPTVITGAGNAPIDLGLVGDVVALNQRLLGLLLDAGYVPVLACIGASADGSLYNINADVVANRVAVELGAHALVLVSDIVGVLRDVNDPASRVPRLTPADFKRAVAAGTVAGGMIPKLEESFASIAAGVSRVHVVGQLTPGQLRTELRTPGTVGTALIGG